MRSSKFEGAYRCLNEMGNCIFNVYQLLFQFVYKSANSRRYDDERFLETADKVVILLKKGALQYGESYGQTLKSTPASPHLKAT